jgi:hypothetical protein
MSKGANWLFLNTFCPKKGIEVELYGMKSQKPLWKLSGIRWRTFEFEGGGAILRRQTQ